jgi:IS605 OrfB family transposase
MSHRTYRTRFEAAPAANGALGAYASLYSRVGRVLHARIESHTAATGEPCKAGSFKNAALVEFGLTGRQFNAIAVGLEGRRSSVDECRKLNIETAKDQISRLASTVAALVESLTEGRFNKDKTVRKPLTAKQRNQVLHDIHQKSRSRGIRERRLAAMLDQQERQEISMCFGSRGLFHQQFELEANGYASHAEWLTDWRAARANQFLVLGSKGETSGCQGCVATLAADGSLSVSVRLPEALVAEHGAHIELKGLRFAHGHNQVLAALKANDARKVNATQARAEAKARKEKFSETKVEGGTALTWRFMRDAKGWEVLVSVDAPERPVQSIKAAGRVAVDINAGFLAVAETDYHGNCVAAFSVPCRTQGLSTDQAAAAIGDAVKTVMAHAIQVRKPLVLEKLDFKAKKRGLAAQHPAYARMLSSFAYGRIKSLFEARAFDAGLELFFVNPAFTSVIGRVKYAVPLGITTHEAAAVAIARRSQDVRERAPQPGRVLPVPVKGSVTAWTSPDWMKPQHRAYPWRCIARTLPRLFEREPARTNPAVQVLAARRKPRAARAGEAGHPPAQT